MCRKGALGWGDLVLKHLLSKGLEFGMRKDVFKEGLKEKKGQKEDYVLVQSKNQSLGNSWRAGPQCIDREEIKKKKKKDCHQGLDWRRMANMVKYVERVTEVEKRSHLRPSWVGSGTYRNPKMD